MDLDFIGAALSSTEKRYRQARQAAKGARARISYLVVCAAGPAIAVYTPPRDDLPRLHWLVDGDDLRGYPKAALYQLTSHCVVNP